MTYNLKMLNSFSLRERLLHEVTKICWGDFVSLYPFHLDKRNNQECAGASELINHRQKASKKISELSPFLPKILVDELAIAVIRLQRGYSEALVCARMHLEIHTIVTPNPLTTGPYAAKNFIDPTGHFNELFWAKRYISEETTPVHSRFELACHYCFDEVTDLWLSLKESDNRHPYEGSFNSIRLKFNVFVALWVFHLDNKFETIANLNDHFALGFDVSGFINAKMKGNEYAARFFWNRCSDTQKSSLMNEWDERDVEELTNVATRKIYGCLSFVYSLLSFEQKRYFFISSRYQYFIWSSLLVSPFYESALNDILSGTMPLTVPTFLRIFNRLTDHMKEMPILDYGKVFKALWESLLPNERNGILEIASLPFLVIAPARIIENLIAMKATGLLKTVIQPFPHAQKERMLLDDWQSAGISAIDSFSRSGDYDALHSYLLLFLMEPDPTTKKLIVSDNAFNLLDRFINGKKFIEWQRGQIPEYERRGVKKVLDSLQGSLQALSSVLEQIEEMNRSSTENKSVDSSVLKNGKTRSEVDNLKRSSRDPIQDNCKQPKLE